jgi:formylglycine-generating enzyme required for sulfatase activity
MNKESLNLKSIDALIKHLESKGNLETSKFLSSVRSHYRTDNELRTRKSIPTENILKSLVGENKVPDGYFIALKALVNATLTKLFNQKLTSFHLNIDHQNKFALSQSIVAPKHPQARTPRGQIKRTGFKASEMMFNLPREIHEQFKFHLESIKDQEGELSAKLEDLILAENNLVKEKESTEHGVAKAQKEILSKFENLRKNLDLNIATFKDEISQLKNVIARTQDEYSKSLNKKRFATDSLQKTSQDYEKRIREHSKQFEQLFNKLTKLYSSTSANEEEFFKRKTLHEEQYKTKELKLEKLSESLNRQQKELNTQARQLTIAKRNYKAQLDTDFKKRMDELNTSFAIRADHHKRISEEEVSAREMEELQKLDNQYLALRISLEQERALVESEQNDLDDKKYAEELILQKKRELLIADEKEKLQAVRLRETEISDKLNATQSKNASLEEQLQETNNFLTEIRDIYEAKIVEQNSDYKSFKLRIQELENESQRFSQMLRSNEKKNVEASNKLQKSFEKQLKEKIAFIEHLELNQKEKICEYQNYIKDNQQTTRTMQLDEKNKRDLILKNLINHENRLHEIGEAFEELSKSFQKQTEKNNLTILPEESVLPREPISIVKNPEGSGRFEWNQAIKQRMEKPDPEQISDIDLSANKLIRVSEEWVLIPAGTFKLRVKNSRKSTTWENATIKHPIKIKKYPVTNLEFFQFVNETNYITEAEKGVTAIVYYPGLMAEINSSDSLHAWPSFTPDEKAYWLCPKGRDEPIYEKQFHPVTQVTWNDALAYCQWKSEVTGSIIRLPTDIEWEYAAKNLGKLGSGQFPWEKMDIAKYCNIEESERFDTTPVNEFPLHDLTGGLQDMFGNVQEWVMDSFTPTPETNIASSKKITRGGSFINTLKELDSCQRSFFPSQYCSGYIGFRVACESD